jgi:CRP/FNR family cyclic AMP-dependent transcriptional regulator
VGNPIISRALARERARDREKEAANSRQAHELICSHLSSVRLFGACGKKEINAIAKAAKLLTVYSGTQLITEGEEGSTMYVVLDGTARVSRNGRKLNSIGPGDTVGELALLSKGPRTATVVATSDMDVAAISSRQLAAVLKDAPTFARKLLESLADLVRELDKKVV